MKYATLVGSPCDIEISRQFRARVAQEFDEYMDKVVSRQAERIATNERGIELTALAINSLRGTMEYIFTTQSDARFWCDAGIHYIDIDKFTREYFPRFMPEAGTIVTAEAKAAAKAAESVQSATATTTQKESAKMSDFSIKIDGERASIYTPYNADFVSRIKLMGGRWDSSNKCWGINVGLAEDVRALMRDIYGRDDTAPAETVDVVLRIEKALCKSRSAVALLGRTIARAFGRDSVAKIGDGVCFIKGAPESGGSRMNWETIVPAGCVVKLIDIPRSVLENTDLPEGVTMEIVGAGIDRDALSAERERLLARLVEIDKLLGA